MIISHTCLIFLLHCSCPWERYARGLQKNISAVSNYHNKILLSFIIILSRSSRHKLLPSEVTAPTNPQRSVLTHNISTISESPSAHIYDEMIECSVESSPAHLTRSINHQPAHPYDEVTLSYSHNTVPIPPPLQFRSSHKVSATSS